LGSNQLEPVAGSDETDGLTDAEIAFRNVEREDVPFRDDGRFPELEADDVAL
jgi:hypothetical protein